MAEESDGLSDSGADLGIQRGSVGVVGVGFSDRLGSEPQQAELVGGEGQGGFIHTAEHDARAQKVKWGDYAPAVARWEHLIGRPAPHPAPDGRLNPVFVEWMIGLPEGWVTGRGLARTAELRMLGNGVVPQQAEVGTRLLLGRLVLAVAS